MAIKRLDFTKRGFRLIKASDVTFWEEKDWRSFSPKLRAKILKKCEKSTDGDIVSVKAPKKWLRCVWCIDEPNVVQAIKCRKVIYQRDNERFEVYFSKVEEDENEAVAFHYSFMDYVAVVPMTACRDMEWEDIEALVKESFKEAPKFIDTNHYMNVLLEDATAEKRKKNLEEAKAKWEEKWN